MVLSHHPAIFGGIGIVVVKMLLVNGEQYSTCSLRSAIT